MKLNVNTFRFVSLALVLEPIWWILGIGWFVFHVIALVIIFTDFNSLKPRNLFQYLLLCLIFELSFSMGVAAAMASADASRLFAAINNISILVVGYIIYGFLYNKLTRNPYLIESIATSLGKVNLAALAIGLPCVYLLFFKHVDSLAFPTIFGLLTPPKDNLLGLYQKMLLIDTDWFNGETTPRLTILSTNATSSAAMVVFSGYFFLASIAGRRKKFYTCLFLTLLTCVMLATLTRGAIIGLALGIFSFFILSTRKYIKIAVASALVMALIGLAFVGPIFDGINSARQASSDTRAEGYKMSWEMTMQNNPLIGLGVKPRTDNLQIPIGSHSTIFSTLVRGGLLGTFLAISTFFLVPLHCFFTISYHLIRRRDLGRRPASFAAVMAAGVPSFIFFCGLQDIDAYAPLSAFLFSYLAILAVVARKIRNHNKSSMFLVSSFLTAENIQSNRSVIVR